MPKSITRTYSRYTQEAMQLMGRLIRASRKKQKMTTAQLAERAGISRGLVQRIEKGDLKCEIGVVFEVATILRIRLFDQEESGLKEARQQVEDKLALMPRSIHPAKDKVDDEF